LKQTATRQETVQEDSSNFPNILGFDIGGTKTAIVLGNLDAEIACHAQIPTPAMEPFEIALKNINDAARNLLNSAREKGIKAPQSISVAIGGPLDIEQGIIFSPPNLPGWDQVPLKEQMEAEYGLPVFIEHDGNAGALAEFYFGAGRGVRNLIFITMGTGLGAGIILNGQIYHGSTDSAGEVGHVRLAPDGPLEYGKAGSWEGFCSGSGIAKLAQLRAPDRWAPDVSTKEITRAALAGDREACQLIEEVGRWLGQGLAMLVDILNPDVIIIGTLGVLLGDLLLEPARKVLQQEALPIATAACRIVPAQLGSAIGDVASLMAVIHAYCSQRLILPPSTATDRVVRYLQAGTDVRQRAIKDLAPQIASTGRLITDVLHRGGKVLLCGNGGSAAAAQHLAGELMGRFQSERSPLPAIALTADSSVITCIGNDYEFEAVFARQVQALARKGDVVIGITTSGRSANVLRALVTAQDVGVDTIALTGKDGLASPVADYVLAVPSSVTAFVQEVHEAIIHTWCDAIDEAFK